MRVVFFQHTAVIGGASWCLLEILRRLNPAEFERHVVIRERGPLWDALTEAGCDVHWAPRMGVQMPSYSAYFDRRDWPARLPYVLLREAIDALRTAAIARAWCTRLRPDAVHVNTVALYPAAVGARRAGVPRIVLHNREHWTDYAWHPLRTALKNRWVAAGVDRILAITREGARVFGGVDRTEIVRDWPSFDPRGRARDLAAECGVSPNAFVVLYPGGLASYKGGRVAIDSWNLVRSADVVLVLLGYDPKGWSGRGLSRDLARLRPDRRASVVCLPKTLDLMSLIRRSGVVLSPFTAPHASKAILDAAQLGVPSIASDWPEAREYLDDGLTGLLIPPGDPVALAAAIDRLGADREWAAALGRAAAEKVGREFSAERSMNAIVAALRGEAAAGPVTRRPVGMRGGAA